MIRRLLLAAAVLAASACDLDVDLGGSAPVPDAAFPDGDFLPDPDAAFPDADVSDAAQPPLPDAALSDAFD